MKSIARDKRHSHCGACVNAKNKAAWNDSDRQGKKARTAAALARNAAIVALAKDRPCMDCGGTFHPVAMDFDHRDPAEKLFSIAQARGRSVATLLAEIAKCDLVCANCHRVRTHVRRP